MLGFFLEIHLLNLSDDVPPLALTFVIGCHFFQGFGWLVLLLEVKHRSLLLSLLQLTHPFPNVPLFFRVAFFDMLAHQVFNEGKLFPVGA